MVTISLSTLAGSLCTIFVMSEPKPEYEIKPGQPPLGFKKQTVYFKMALLTWQKKHIEQRAKESGVSAAEYVRNLIDHDMSQSPPPTAAPMPAKHSGRE